MSNVISTALLRRGVAEKLNSSPHERVAAVRRYIHRWRILLQPVSVFGLGIIIAVWVGVAFQLSVERSAVEDLAIARGRSSARMVADATFQLINGVDRSLLILRQDYEDNPERFDLNRQAARIAIINTATIEVSWIGPNGWLKARTGYKGPSVDLSDREHFQAQVNATEDKLFISKPVVLKTSGKSQIQLTRRLRKADGSFDGMLSASVDPSFVEKFQRSLGFGEKSAISVRGMDGISRASYGLASDNGRYSTGLLAALARGQDGYIWGRGTRDGVTRLLSFRIIPEYSLIVIIGEPEERIFADYNHNRSVYRSVAALVTLLVLFAVAFILSRQTALERASSIAEKLRRQRDIAIDSMAQGLCMFDAERRLIVCNKKYAEIYGLGEEHTKPGTPLRAIIERRVVNNSVPEGFQRHINDWLNDEAVNKPFEIVQPLIDGRFIAVFHRPTAEGGWVSTHEDITNRQMSQARVEHMALHDGLTGLGNRASLMDRIEEACTRCRLRGETFGLLLLDLDRFKEINDTLGHPAGDALLQSVAERLTACVRETDAIARLGGDEFAIIQASETDQREASSKLADRIIADLCRPFSIEDNEVHIGASIGIALAPEHGINADDIMKMSDMALYSAKENGGNCHHIFDIAMTDAMIRRHELEHDLRHAIENDQLELHFQPIINASTCRICGAEALIRWQHPTKGTIAPDRFIPLAEDTGLISQIGEWALHAACVEAATWPAGVKVSVNLSPKQFRDPTLIDVVVYILAETGLPADRLEFEITETALIELATSILPVLRQFKNSWHHGRARRLRYWLFIAQSVDHIPVR